jgi:hypothetical protein
MGAGSRAGHTAAGRTSLRVGLQSFRRQPHTLGRKLWEWNARGPVRLLTLAGRKQKRQM